MNHYTKPVKPRDYQEEACEWALTERKAVVCMPTGTGKTLIAGLWIKRLMEEEKITKILVLEPTRFMVEQTHSYFQKVLHLPSRQVHGSLSRRKISEGLEAKIVVATPEIMLTAGRGKLSQFDAVVVDECHHTTGEDSYKIVIENIKAPWRLGLTPFIPRSRQGEIEKYIGKIRCWSWKDPRISKYIPEWVGEVYESPLNQEEWKLYTMIEDMWNDTYGKDKILLGNALRWLVRDGVLSLRETLSKGGRLRELLTEDIIELINSNSVRELHKLDALRRVLEDYGDEFAKGIIFTDRVIVARRISQEPKISRFNPILLLGRRHVDPRKALITAGKKETKLIIATSAGEEGIDLPEADLLILWSNTASPLRFIQRLGRILRPSKDRKVKYVVFIATPDTVDMDSLIDGLLQAEKAGVNINISPDTVKRLWNLSRRRRVLEVIEETPAPIDVIAKFLSSPVGKIEAALNWLLRNGYAGYIYSDFGKIFYSKDSLDQLTRKYSKYLRPDEKITAKITIYFSKKKKTTYKGSYSKISRKLGNLLASKGVFHRIHASMTLQVRRDLVRLVNLDYHFPIYSNRELNLIVRNIFNMEKH